MNLPDALSRLHAAGRIKRPWLAGMLLRTGGVTFRLHENQGPGLVVIDPDLTDPATTGCLASLAREALADSFARAKYSRSRGLWQVWRSERHLLVESDSEGGAWAAVLIAEAMRD